MEKNKGDLLIWNSQIPVMITISHEFPPVFFLVSRIHYIGLYYHEITCYLNQKNQKPSQSLWLSYNKAPVQWNIPFGVFYDLLIEKKPILPISLQVHFDMPPKDFLPHSSVFNEKNYFFWDLKQASCIKFENDASNILMSLPAKKYDLLWDFFQNNKRSEFMEIFKILWDPLINLKEKRKGVHVLPIRIYYNERGVKRVQRGLLIENDIITIGDSIKDLFPEIAQFKMVCHGIILPYETPIKYLYENFFYYDGFVYIVLISI